MTKVYVMAPESGTPCKIGISTDPRSRLSCVQTGFPEKLILWSSWGPEHLSAREIEARAHMHFSDRRLNGEWFDITVCEAERFIGKIELEFDGFWWATTHSCSTLLRVYSNE